MNIGTGGLLVAAIGATAFAVFLLAVAFTEANNQRGTTMFDDRTDDDIPPAYPPADVTVRLGDGWTVATTSTGTLLFSSERQTIEVEIAHLRALMNLVCETGLAASEWERHQRAAAAGDGFDWFDAFAPKAP